MREAEGSDLLPIGLKSLLNCKIESGGIKPRNDGVFPPEKKDTGLGK